MVTSTGYPQDYDRLDGEWLMWYQVAHRFERKVPIIDREDIRHSIILELALARRRMGNTPINEALGYRIASFVVADYWRKVSRKPTIFSLDRETDNGDTTGLMDTIIDDKAIDVTAWIDAKTWLLGCPIRLVQIANKKIEGKPLTNGEAKLYTVFGAGFSEIPWACLGSGSSYARPLVELLLIPGDLSIRDSVKVIPTVFSLVSNVQTTVGDGVDICTIRDGKGAHEIQYSGEVDLKTLRVHMLHALGLQA